VYKKRQTDNDDDKFDVVGPVNVPATNPNPLYEMIPGETQATYEQPTVLRKTRITAPPSPGTSPSGSTAPTPPPRPSKTDFIYDDPDMGTDEIST
jgi:hypothetical protein